LLSSLMATAVTLPLCCRRGRCGWRAALIRTLLRVVGASPLLFGGLPAGVAILVSKRKQRLGDLAAARW
jgi:uncharacterized RDD family membrane protein YckC